MIRIDAKEFLKTRSRRKQIEWFERTGYRYECDTNNVVFTTDDWLNLRDKGLAVNDDSGFDVGFLNVS